MDLFSLSIYLAQLIGLFFLIIGIAFIVRPVDFQSMAKETIKSSPTIIVVSSLRLMVGIAIILSHNIWVLDWRVVITILGWMSFILALAGLFFLKEFANVFGKFLSNKRAFMWIGIILCVIGAYLSYNGFFF